MTITSDISRLFFTTLDPSCFDFVYTQDIHLFYGLDYNCCFSESISYLSYLHVDIVSNFSIFHKYYKSLDSCNTISLSTDFRNVYFIFLTYFDWFWTRRASIEASTSTAPVTPASTMTILAASTVTHS